MAERPEVNESKRNFLKGTALAAAIAVIPDRSFQAESGDSVKAVIEEGSKLKEGLGIENMHSTPWDWAGVALFGKAMAELLPAGRGHIGATEYGILAALIAGKHATGDEHTKQ